jgi:hypothetical protein
MTDYRERGLTWMTACVKTSCVSLSFKKERTLMRCLLLSIVSLVFAFIGFYKVADRISPLQASISVADRGSSTGNGGRGGGRTT